MAEPFLLQLEIYLSEFIELYCVKGNKETCLVSELKYKFQTYTNIDYSRIDISNVMINKLRYSYIVIYENRHFKGLSLKR